MTYAQVERPLTWLEDLNFLERAASASPTEQRQAVLRIRAEVQNWLKLHPTSTVKLQALPPEPWSAETITVQISSLRKTVENILQEDPARPFHLGVAEVNVTATMSPLSPVADSIDHVELTNRDARTVSEAIEFLPGVSVDHKKSRNQTGVSLRGFDTRQVPVYLDGIPIYIPYDGYVDLSRFLTGDVAEVQVAKSFSSPLLGPNALGGSLNIVSRAPVKRLQGESFIGTGSGNALNSGAHFGSKWQHFFLQGSLDWLQTDSYPLPDSYPLNTNQPSYDRLNSYQADQKYSGRFGWTPHSGQEYVFTYINQKGDYGVPPSDGSDPNDGRVKYWRWPYWNKNSYYFNSTTALGYESSLRLRAYYDQYRNLLNMYDDATYSTMAKTSSGNNALADHTAGTSAEFQTRILPRQVLSMSFAFKDDTDKQTAVSAPNGNGALIAQPWRTNRDQYTSIGLQDALRISSHLRATIGFAADHLDGVQAQDVQPITQTKIDNKGRSAATILGYAVVPFQCTGTTTNTSFAGCTDHIWAFNPVASLSYSIGETGALFVNFSDRSNFPTLKDRYSYKFSQALPNAALQPEHSRNWTFGYSRALASRTMVQLDVFRSDLRQAIETVVFPSNQCPGYAVRGYCSQSQNVGSEVHQGVEFTVRSTPISRLTVDANYSFLNRTIDIAPTVSAPGVYPFGAPKHKAIGTATVRLPRQALALASARYESGTVTVNNANLIVPASKFATMDLGGVIPVRFGTGVQFGVNNLLNRYYFYQLGFPEEGRNWFFTIWHRF